MDFFQAIFSIITLEEKETFREAFATFDKDGNGQISTKVVSQKAKLNLLCRN